jgi:hypothetical protein
VIDGGDFSDPAALAAWRKQDGTVLGMEWSVAGGKLRYFGGSSLSAFYYAARFSLPYAPLPRYTVTVTAKVQSDPGVQVAIGAAWGLSSAGDSPNNLSISPPSEYGSEVTITHTFDHAPTFAGVDGSGRYIVTSFMPVISVIKADAAMLNAVFDDVSMVITPIAVPSTAETLAHIDFDAGLTGWTLTPAPSAYTPTSSTSGGVLTMDVVTDTGLFTHYICEAPITLADAVGKYIGITAEIWCNDATVYAGVPANGVKFGYAVKSGGDYTVASVANSFLRGDFTQHTFWIRIPAIAVGMTYHPVITMRASNGMRCKVRSIEVRVTDSVID